MIRCWYCGDAFNKKLVLRDSVLQGRDPEKGGPFRLYRCARCNRESKIEETPAGRLFASPDREMSTMEYLFSWIKPLAPDDFLLLHHWHQLFDERRGAYFTHDGDHRYRKRSFKRLLLRLFSRRGSGRAKWAPSSAAADNEVTSPARESVPHPYRILGISIDASEEEIRKSFGQLARNWHPDKRGQQSEADVAEARRRLQELVEAYEALMKKH